MVEETLHSPNSTFVVRFWQAWSDAGPIWRGRIEHVQSGKSVTFLQIEKMVDFMRGFGIMVIEGGPAQGEEGRE